MGTGFLHHPTLNQFTFLAGITAIHNHIGLLHQPFDDAELLFVGGVTDKLDAKTWWHHGQIIHAPRLPIGGIIVRFFQGTKVAIRPRHLIPISLNISLFLRLSP